VGEGRERGERVDGIRRGAEDQPAVVVLTQFGGAEQAHAERYVPDPESTHEHAHRGGATARSDP
jgi:hypothetical protein